ncbi:MAG: hypothetical protein H8D70_00540 [Rhodospirillaceae bacterium]|nr:hypothetical protein [Rhodospirillaceae bacterium]
MKSLIYGLMACCLVAMSTLVGGRSAAALEPVAIQLDPVAIQLKVVRNRPLKIYFSIFFELKDVELIASVCQKTRQFYEVAVLAADEFRKNNKTDKLKELEERIRYLILNKYSSSGFYNVHVISENMRFGQGSLLINNEGTTGRCRSLNRVPLHVLANSHRNEVPDLQTDFDPRRMLDGVNPLAIATSGMTVPFEEASSPNMMLFIGVAVALGLIGMAGVVYEKRRRARRAKAEADKEEMDRRADDIGPPDGNEKRGKDNRRNKPDRRGSGDRRIPKGSKSK